MGGGLLSSSTLSNIPGILASRHLSLDRCPLAFPSEHERDIKAKVVGSWQMCSVVQDIHQPTYLHC